MQRWSEDEVRQALDDAWVGVFEWDPQAGSARLSSRQEQIWGFEAGSFDGRADSLFARIHFEDLEPLQRDLERCCADRVPLAREFRVHGPDGRPRWVACRGNFAREGGCFRGFVTEFTPSRIMYQRERELDRLNRLYAALSQVNQAIVLSQDANTLFERVCQALVNDGGFSMAWIGSVDPITGVVTPAASCGDVGHLEGLVISTQDALAWQPPTARAVRLGEAQICNDLRLENVTDQFRERWNSHNLRSCAAFPVPSQDRVVASMSVFADETDYFQEREVGLLLEAASDISFALGNLERERKRKQAELRLRNERDFSDAVLNSLPGVLYLYNQEGRFLRWNDNFEQVTGYSGEEIAKMHPGQFFREDYRSELRTRIAEVFADGKACLEADFLCKDGTAIPYHFTGVRARVSGQLCLVGVGIDIEQRVQAESARVASEGRYRTLFEHAPDGILIASSDGVYWDANDTMCRMLGCARNDLIGLSGADIVAESELPNISSAIGEILDRSHYHREWVFRRKDAGVFPAEVIATQMPDGSILAVVRDITERKANEKALHELNSGLQNMLELQRIGGKAARLGGWTLDYPGRFLKRTDEVCALLDLPPESQLTLDELFAFVEPRTRPLVEAALAACEREHAPFDLEAELVTAKGRPVWVRAIGEAILDVSGCLRRIQGALQDITDRKRIELQFLRSQRIESIGTLAGGVAHDLNNVLAPILMSISLLKMDETDDHRRETLSTIESCAKRGADMVRQVLSFARGVEGQRLPVDLPQLVKELMKIVRDTFPKNIRLGTETQQALFPLNGDPTQLHQVLLNLCVNARDAMPSGGTLSLKTSNEVLDEQFVSLYPEAKPGPYVKILVEDSGYGVPPEALEKIFDPFFTTKEFGKGTGLGLSTSLVIVRSHGGFMRVESEPGKGTRFCVYLPASEGSVAATNGGVDEPPRGRGELILVVDDEASVRNITMQTLKAYDYQVLVATDGAEAVAIFAMHRNEIALVITDMVMPIMDGSTTILALQRIKPSVPIIAVSGQGTSELSQVACFLAKPYTASHLLKSIHQVLGKALEVTQEV